MALTGQRIVPACGRLLRPLSVDLSRIKSLFKQVCRLADPGNKNIEQPEAAPALERLHAVIHWLTRDGTEYNSETRHGCVREASLMTLQRKAQL
ncbi:hypothetical protein [Bradyrhizobium tropiciagri]|uniref:hypothetical protein n=1 Tax=Bradyrhizobium tropiciagri TaxID=312253 RepID=UPI00067D0DC6|nr:hypothetical protein [Bradyrhizobium tropiciagri]